LSLEGWGLGEENGNSVTLRNVEPFEPDRYQLAKTSHESGRRAGCRRPVAGSGTFRTTLTCITAARVFMYCNQRTNDSIAAEAFNADHFLHVAAEQ
jgi:hypothetical protein